MRRNYFQLLWLALLLAAPLVLWALPGSFFDDTGITICPSKLLLGIECLGCGMTRAVMHFHHVELETALGFNRGVVLAYPALVALWIFLVKKAVEKKPFSAAQ
ncbi:MAG: DUF2752 domain-containing protein [Saprospiraceae bacterium]|jgi:hypothetical protein|nr:DUF2752 domain-containing protein [Saprospiraceae bacterium]